jgi:hypothetical protein
MILDLCVLIFLACFIHLELCRVFNASRFSCTRFDFSAPDIGQQLQAVSSWVLVFFNKKRRQNINLINFISIKGWKVCDGRPEHGV